MVFSPTAGQALNTPGAVHRIHLASSYGGNSGHHRRRSWTIRNHSYFAAIAISCPIIAVLENPSRDEQVETFEDGFVVSDYVKSFEKKKPLNGNAGMWDWGVTKIFGKAYPQVTCVISVSYWAGGCPLKLVVRCESQQIRLT